MGAGRNKGRTVACGKGDAFCPGMAGERDLGRKGTVIKRKAFVPECAEEFFAQRIKGRNTLYAGNQNGVLRAAEICGFAKREPRSGTGRDASAEHVLHIGNTLLGDVSQKCQCNMVVFASDITPGDIILTGLRPAEDCPADGIRHGNTEE